MKYIDAEDLQVIIEKRINNIESCPFIEAEFGAEMRREGKILAYNDILTLIDSLQQEQPDMGEVSDGYHTFNELYYYRMLYNAAFFNLLPKEWVHKSKRHHTGEECFGGGWFIVMANLPTGQISNHYELKDWDLFQVPEKEFADEWDGHTPQEAAERLHRYLQQEQPTLNESQQEFVDIVTERMLKERPIPTLKGKQKAEFEKEFNRFKQITGMINFPAHMEVYKRIILWFMAWGADNLPNLNKVTDPNGLDFQQEQPEVDLEKELDKFYGMYRKDGKTYDITDDEEVSDWKEDGNSWFKIEFARHFYELGQLEMRHRITNPEYNAKVVEQLKSEYPVRKED